MPSDNKLRKPRQSQSFVPHTAHERFDDGDDTEIDWSNLIFLPFNPIFRTVVLVCVVTKVIMGPIQSVYSFLDCWDFVVQNEYLTVIMYFYEYGCDFIYAVDTFLHIAHRQVTDKATRREHWPKSGYLLLLDICSLIPFMTFMSPDECPEAKLWPNILAFNEVLIIYRVWEYFSLVSSHSYLNLFVGFSLLFLICISCIGCFWILLTMEGLCSECNNAIYDWRLYVLYKLNLTDPGFATYIFGSTYVLSLSINKHLDEYKPSTIIEFIMMSLFILTSYIVLHFVLVPKIFCESILRLRQIIDKYPGVKKILNETFYRNPERFSYEKEVNDYLNLVWVKRHGILDLPRFFQRASPRYLRLEIKEDLLWQIFQHSPTLRKTSEPFQRFICEEMCLHYKLPGEKLYSCVNKRSNYYYIKSGVVQIISAEDGTTPILSVTSGTIFGDVSSLVPHFTCDVIIRCLTYCEIYIIKRASFLRAINKYKTDSILIRESVKKRMQHARTLYNSKVLIKGTDRNIDEGIAWIKRRWWEIFFIIRNARKKLSGIRYELPSEEVNYHCPKYLGQLVLCTDAELRENAMFVNLKFPWILSPESSFISAWHRIVTVTVLLVMLTFPPNLTRRFEEIPSWFRLFSFWTDLIYIIDIGISLLTAVKVAGYVTTTFSEVMFERCKSLNFIFDVLATIWVEDIVSACGLPQYYYGAKFNRLIKIYMLFVGENVKWHINENPFIKVAQNVLLIQVAYVILMSHFIYELGLYYIHDLTFNYFFGNVVCGTHTNSSTPCVDPDRVFGVAVLWFFEYTFSEYLPATMNDTYINAFLSFLIFIIHFYCKGHYISYLYLSDMHVMNYRNFVSNVVKYYQINNIHQNLLSRLNQHFTCHWKYFRGIDIMRPNQIAMEPADIVRKCLGEMAQKKIERSRMFLNADPGLIREIARQSMTLVVPRNSTAYLFGTHGYNFCWLLRGYVASQFHGDDGVLVKKVYQSRNCFNVLSVLLRKPAITTHVTHTECEFLYIGVQELLTIYKRYPVEWQYLESCIDEFRAQFDDVFLDNLVKHREYQQKVREEEIEARERSRQEMKIFTTFSSKFWGAPSSKFMKKWLKFRVFIVFLSISVSSLHGGLGARYYWACSTLSAFCDCIAWMDIVFKLFLNYYGPHGTLITNRRKCFLYYFTRGFILDIIGALPLSSIIKALMSVNITEGETRLFDCICKFAHIYIVFAFFTYISDKPSAKMTEITIIKWQLINFLIMLGASNYLLVRCIDVEYDSSYKTLLKVTKREECWDPRFLKMPAVLEEDDFQTLRASGINLAQCGLTRMNFGRFFIERDHFGVGLVLFALGALSWFVMCHTLAVLVMASRSNTLFQHGVNRLIRFLNYERIDKKTISRSVVHFRYCWMRTKGVNIQQLSNERLGLVFGQDLNFYFFKQTFALLDTLLKGGEQLERRMAGLCLQGYFMPGQDIIREMHLSPKVYIIHRGKVKIIVGGKKVALLTKGDLFGQLLGTKLLPVHITAQSDDYVDVLEIDVAAFQQVINDEVRSHIEQDPHSKINYMTKTRSFIESPHDQARYLLRERKTIKLPWSETWTEGHHGSWYFYWLYITWLFEPFFSAVISSSVGFMPEHVRLILYAVLIILDLLHLANFIAEFYTVQFFDIKHSYMGWKRLKTWTFYIDLVSLVTPLFTLLAWDWWYQLARILRLKMFFDFNHFFCTSFKSVTPSVLLKFGITLLVLHFCACSWIYVSCRYDIFPIAVPPLPEAINKTIDYTEWMHPNDRGGGCAKVTSNFKKDERSRQTSFLVPRSWWNDYVLAMTYVLLIFSHTNVDVVLPVTTPQIYCKVLITFVIYLLDIWIMSVAINASYASLRDLYQYDYTVKLVSTYFKDRGLCKYLINCYQQYSRLLWNRHKGGMWLPDLVHKGPPCLRQDIFSALYMHHFNEPPTFAQIPDYFKQQLVDRVERMVVYPGKCIAREGDTFCGVYFIHEGEVEKWYIGSDGENKLLSVLYTNGYFGLISGLFVNEAYKFSYYSRTVVDLLILNLDMWKDLLEAYPDVKKTLFETTATLKKEYEKCNYGKFMPCRPSTIYKNTKLNLNIGDMR